MPVTADDDRTALVLVLVRSPCEGPGSNAVATVSESAARVAAGDVGQIVGFAQWTLLFFGASLQHPSHNVSWRILVAEWSSALVVCVQAMRMALQPSQVEEASVVAILVWWQYFGLALGVDAVATEGHCIRKRSAVPVWHCLLDREYEQHHFFLRCAGLCGHRGVQPAHPPCLSLKTVRLNASRI